MIFVFAVAVVFTTTLRLHCQPLFLYCSSSISPKSMPLNLSKTNTTIIVITTSHGKKLTFKNRYRWHFMNLYWKRFQFFHAPIIIVVVVAGFSRLIFFLQQIHFIFLPFFYFIQSTLCSFCVFFFAAKSHANLNTINIMP